MLKTLVFSLIIALILILSSETPALAQTKLARPSAALTVELEDAHDERVEILSAFLKKYNSPFADQAHIFVREADKNNLDWRFVAAISGVESTFGNAYPEGSYNAWGWGIYGTNRHGFASWEDAITTISGELRSRYMDKWGAKDVYEIGNYYAASPTWASRVTYFMEKITAYESTYSSSQLPISL
ncbi:MAG: hypothetical protein RLZZ455_768 [Candidatus Parcubacteria bacterium]|jgi:hypothetical protein